MSVTFMTGIGADSEYHLNRVRFSTVLILMINWFLQILVIILVTEDFSNKVKQYVDFGHLSTKLYISYFCHQ